MSTFFDFLLYNLALDHPLPQPGARRVPDGK